MNQGKFAEPTVSFLYSSPLTRAKEKGESHLLRRQRCFGTGKMPLLEQFLPTH